MSMMSMTHERFTALAEAYGGDLDRWPADEQGPARALLEEDLHLALVLGGEGAVDALLASASEPAFSGVLRERLIAGAPRPGAHLAVRKWLSGAGLAAACAVGVLFGAQYSDHLIGDPAATAVAQATTSFDDQGDILGLEDAG